MERPGQDEVDELVVDDLREVVDYSDDKRVRLVVMSRGIFRSFDKRASEMVSQRGGSYPAREASDDDPGGFERCELAPRSLDTGDSHTRVTSQAKDPSQRFTRSWLFVDEHDVTHRHRSATPFAWHYESDEVGSAGGSHGSMLREHHRDHPEPYAVGVRGNHADLPGLER